MKVCNKCKEEKDLDCYYKEKGGKYYRAACKKCSNQVSNTYKEANSDKVKLYRRKHHLNLQYSITLEQYNEMFAAQEGKCKICATHQSEQTVALAVDHCHTTGTIRGLLCGDCNRALGLFRDDIKSLEKAITYLSGPV